MSAKEARETATKNSWQHLIHGINVAVKNGNFETSCNMSDIEKRQLEKLGYIVEPATGTYASFNIYWKPTDNDKIYVKK